MASSNIHSAINNSLSFEADDDVLKSERRFLRRHLGLGPEAGDPPSHSPQFQPLFFIEMAPDSSQGAKCKLPNCNKTVLPGKLRLALNPAMSCGRYRTSADFYHIHCFEKIADFSNADFSARILPLSRSTWKDRGLKAGSILDGNYLVPGGVERLVLEWKVTRGKLQDKRDGVEKVEADLLSAAFDALLHQAGSAAYQEQTKPEGMTDYEYNNLLYRLAPYESDGSGNTEEWNLFATYLDSATEALDNPHDLSVMLEKWQNDVILANTEEGELDEVGRAAKHRLSGNAVRALKRLSAIPMPQTGFGQSFLYGPMNIT